MPEPASHQQSTTCRRVLYFAGTHGNWGGSSRVLFTNLKLLDRSRFEPLVLITRDGPAREACAALGIRCEVWGPMTEFRSPLKYLRALWRTLRFLRRERIDIVHLNRANDWRPAEYLAAKILGIPMVSHFHTVNLDGAPATRMVCAIAAVSDFVGRNSNTLGRPVRVIHNAVDSVAFGQGNDVRPALGLTAAETVVTFAGQIRRIKGIDTFIEAARQVSGDDVRFLIAGECRTGRGREDVLSVDELDALVAGDPRIRYIGYRTDMPDIYRSSDIIVMPSRWEEPFGLISIEAAAAGKPVIATCTGGIPEVVVDQQTGLLIQPGDAAELSTAMQRLVDDAALRSRLGSTARAHVQAMFTNEPVRALEQLYDDLIENRV